MIVGDMYDCFFLLIYSGYDGKSQEKEGKENGGWGDKNCCKELCAQR
jgi:hypothetical protein